jgi:hypothetical protein
MGFRASHDGECPRLAPAGLPEPSQARLATISPGFRL